MSCPDAFYELPYSGSYLGMSDGGVKIKDWVIQRQYTFYCNVIDFCINFYFLFF